MTATVHYSVCETPQQSNIIKLAKNTRLHAIWLTVSPVLSNSERRYGRTVTLSCSYAVDSYINTNIIIIHRTIFIVLSSTAWSHMREFSSGPLSESQPAIGGRQLVGQAANLTFESSYIGCYRPNIRSSPCIITQP